MPSPIWDAWHSQASFSLTSELVKDSLGKRKLWQKVRQQYLSSSGCSRTIYSSWLKRGCFSTLRIKSHPQRSARRAAEVQMELVGNQTPFSWGFIFSWMWSSLEQSKSEGEWESIKGGFYYILLPSSLTDANICFRISGGLHHHRICSRRWRECDMWLQGLDERCTQEHPIYVLEGSVSIL